MKKTTLALLTALLPLFLAAQLTDDFSDGNFTDDPSWLGDVDKFTVTNGELQLQDTEAGTAALYLPAATSTDASTSWAFFIRLEFAPSSSNFARVYLSASSTDLTGEVNGYYLRIGGISGSDDALELYRQDGSNSELLLSGTLGALGNEPALARVRVTRETDGAWMLEADYSGGTDYTLEGSVTDDTYPMGGFFGWACEYTSTRADKFFLDDIQIDPLFVDTEPPTLLEATAESAFSVIARFNEPLEAVSANTAANFTIDQGIGAPASAELQGDQTSVLLSLGSALENTATYTLTADGISDAEGNTAGPQSQSFTFFDIEEAAPGDLIISEIFPDPTPSLGLPEAEYLELYNRSGKVIDLSGIGIASGGSPEPIEEYLLLPGNYVTICDEDVADQFAALGPTAAVSSFPALTNGGDEAAIARLDGTSLFGLTYSDSWYRDPERAGGGYSLELIRLEGPYDCPGNWRASQSSSGGTPGQANSLQGAPQDTVPPSLLRAAPETSNEIRLTFSEVMEENSALEIANYGFSPSLPIMDVLLLAGGTEVLIVLQDSLQSSVAYELSVSSDVRDCIGNRLAAGSVLIGLPEAAEAQDIVINEILFNPNTGGADFLELYNRSGKIIDLFELQMFNFAKMSGDTEGSVEDKLLIFPGDYLVLSEDPDNIQLEYSVEQPARLVENDLPSFDDDAGNITLRWRGITLDSFDYTEDYHYPLLDDEDGVSLERVSPDAPTQDPGNWHSAASTAGFATPTAPNSQFFEQPGEFPNVINIPNTTFSPDGDGFEDILLIQYETSRPGYTLNLWVFDAVGREIIRLENNEILANRGTLKWDGVAADGSPARAGIYVLFFELFTPDGSVEREKRAVVLAGQLD